ncbi:Os05g0577150, partial [Oryza sativa Japonica Group]
RVHHVECLRVARAHHPLEPRAHVHDVALAAAAAGGGYDAGAHGHRLQRAQHAPVGGAALAAHRVAAALAVAVRAPHRLLEQPLPAARRGGQGGGGAALGALALERDAHKARGHLAHQRGGGRGELQQQRRARARVELEREVHVAAPVAVERAGEPRAEADLPVPPRHGRRQRRAQA